MLFRSNDTATTEIYTLSLHDALPICSLDPVALDSYGLDIVDTKRRETGLHSVRTHAGYIRTAAGLGLGTDNLGDVEIVRSVLG